MCGGGDILNNRVTNRVTCRPFYPDQIIVVVVKVQTLRNHRRTIVFPFLGTKSEPICSTRRSSVVLMEELQRGVLCVVVGKVWTIYRKG